jgi:hypothetical protein
LHTLGNTVLARESNGQWIDRIQTGRTHFGARGYLCPRAAGKLLSFANTGGGPARYLQLFSPGGMERYFAERAAAALYRTDYSRARQLFRESVLVGSGTTQGQAIASISLAMSMGPGSAWPGEDIICEERPLSEISETAEEELRIAQAGEQRIAVCCGSCSRSELCTICGMTTPPPAHTGRRVS